MFFKNEWSYFLRMSGAIFLLLYVLMVWEGKIYW